MRDLLVDMGGLDGEVGPLGLQIADVGEERPIGVGVDRLPAAGLVPRIDPLLQHLAAIKEIPVHRREVVQQGIEVSPEGVARKVETRQNLVLDKGVQLGGDLALSDLYSLDHVFPSPNVGVCRSIKTGCARHRCDAFNLRRLFPAALVDVEREIGSARADADQMLRWAGSSATVKRA